MQWAANSPAADLDVARRRGDFGPPPLRYTGRRCTLYLRSSGMSRHPLSSGSRRLSFAVTSPQLAPRLPASSQSSSSFSHSAVSLLPATTIFSRAIIVFEAQANQNDRLSPSISSTQALSTRRKSTSSRYVFAPPGLPRAILFNINLRIHDSLTHTSLTSYTLTHLRSR